MTCENDYSIPEEIMEQICEQGLDALPKETDANLAEFLADSHCLNHMWYLSIWLAVVVIKYGEDNHTTLILMASEKIPTAE